MEYDYSIDQFHKNKNEVFRGTVKLLVCKGLSRYAFCLSDADRLLRYYHRADHPGVGLVSGDLYSNQEGVEAEPGCGIEDRVTGSSYEAPIHRIGE